ncbi:MBL fold metallo-hydrolase [Arcicella aquatica]|uniref:MBL fold metallo-hydrolase n=1 Tax=Arcicella aquatica TaxID=217141 RepID=A0ABU5QH00_9BACT|nr:MBL fold metallo-hydrolase [Arcicella aquatica]MEA5256332.1 MBL fold metallo-hydrolase [Arcicella aquatica]
MKRRKFIHKIFTLATMSKSGGGILFTQVEKKQVMKTRTNNPDLKTILDTWEGTPIDDEGRYMNHEFPFLPTFGSVFKWMTTKNPQKQFKKEDTWRLPVIKDDAFLKDTQDMIVWLGHASFFIRLNGKQILIDPVLGKIPATKRHSELPISPEKLTKIDYILVSHAHYDHCDKSSLKLLQSQNPKAIVLTGLRMTSLLSKWIPNNEIQEAGWYQQYQTYDDLAFYFLPSRHWSNRSLGDANKRLWGAFVIKSGNKTIYFGGDSGYGSHFKEVATLFPNIDVAMIGAGAYSPRWFMSPNHQDPEHAVQAFNETQAKVMVPFHYGTFDQADEPLSEPEKILTQLESEGQINQTLKILKVGEVLPV